MSTPFDPQHVVDAFDAWRLPFLVVVGIVFAWLLVTVSVRRLVKRDPMRAFMSADRDAISAAVGGRCEHKPVLGLRCRSAGAHADHHVPHRAGGRTNLANLVWLCERHNLAKSGRVPGRSATWRLNRRRRKYWRGDLPQPLLTHRWFQ